MELNERLSTLRKNNNYSTRELASELGVSQSSISLWEKGDRKPDYENIVKLASIYGVSTDYLLGNENNSNKPILTQLKEEQNLILSKISSINQLVKEKQKELEIIIKEKELNYGFLLRMQDNDNFYFHNYDKSIDLSIIDNLRKKIGIIDTHIDRTKKELENTYNTLQCCKEEQKHIKKKYDCEIKKAEQLNFVLQKIENKDFKEIMINSEHDLQFIILKYLDLYNPYKDTDFSVEELLKRLREIIKKNGLL